MKKTTAAAMAAAGAALTVADIYRFTFFRTRSPLSSALFERRRHSDDYYEKRDSAARALEERPHEVLTMISDRGYALNGFYYRAGHERSRTICYIVHGYRSDHAQAAGFCADYYLSRGIDIFCDDHVASGSSGGSFIGYDYLETYDCLKWIETLKKHFGKDVSIILHGFSMGGATVINMSDKCPDNVKFVVSDSGYTDGETILKRGWGAAAGAFFDLMNALTRHLAKYDLRQTDVRGAAKNTRLPVLFVHGTDDPTVPPEMGKELYGICSSPDKKLLLVEGAKHVEAMYRAPERYAAYLDGYIEKYIA